MLGKKNINPLADERKQLYAQLSDEVKAKLDALNNMNSKDYQLRVIKRTKPEVKDGDIFVLSPRENIYFYGKVLKANINHTACDPFVHGKHLVFIFKNKSNNPSIGEFSPKYSELLIKPVIVDISYWNKGLFFNVGNTAIEEFEKGMDYGFLNIGIKSNNYCKEDGSRLNHKPAILGMYGVATITGVAAEVERQLIMYPNLL